MRVLDEISLGLAIMLADNFNSIFGHHTGTCRHPGGECGGGGAGWGEISFTKSR